MINDPLSPKARRVSGLSPANLWKDKTCLITDDRKNIVPGTAVNIMVSMLQLIRVMALTWNVPKSTLLTLRLALKSTPSDPLEKLSATDKLNIRYTY